MTAAKLEPVPTAQRPLEDRAVQLQLAQNVSWHLLWVAAPKGKSGAKVGWSTPAREQCWPVAFVRPTALTTHQYRIHQLLRPRILASALRSASDWRTQLDLAVSRRTESAATDTVPTLRLLAQSGRQEAYVRSDAAIAPSTQTPYRYRAVLYQSAFKHAASNPPVHFCHFSAGPCGHVPAGSASFSNHSS